MVRDEKCLSSETLLETSLFDVKRSLFENNNSQFEAITTNHPNAVCIAATHENNVFYLVDQYRYGLEAITTEFPAGKCDPDESPLAAAHRELAEEIGFSAESLIELGTYSPSPAYSNECIHLYYATDLNYVGQHLDDDESLNVFTKSIEELDAMILNNQITDGKTIALFYRLRHLLSTF